MTQPIEILETYDIESHAKEWEQQHKQAEHSEQNKEAHNDTKK